MPFWVNRFMHIQYIRLYSHEIKSRKKQLHVIAIFFAELKTFFFHKIPKISNTTKIIIENIELETYYSEYFKCDLPVIPDNGNLIEAIASYCMYKMLLRGYKHPVLTLQGNNPAINPYVNWISLKPKVKTSIVLDKQLDISNTNAWRSYFYNFTFIPKN